MSNRTHRELIDDGEPALRNKVAFLSRPESYPGAPEVEVKETRMSWVFLAGNRVYKFKKPVRYPYLDYSTREKRREICETEVSLNRRLAPDVYLGVGRLTSGRDGTLAINGEGEVVEWMVVMRRLPHERLLEEAIGAGTVGRGDIEKVADRLARFYRDLPAERIVPATRIGRMSEEIDSAMEVLGADEFDAIAERGKAIVSALRDILDRSPGIVADRIEAGRIVEGHGDLRPEHVCLTDPPVIIDCLEFSRALRLVDPFDELAFLGMECAAIGARWIGPLLIGRCAERLGDRPSERQLAFYTAYRAMLRARQSLEHLLEPEPREPGKWVPKARRYFDEAERAMLTLRPPAVPPASRFREDGG